MSLFETLDRQQARYQSPLREAEDYVYGGGDRLLRTLDRNRYTSTGLFDEQFAVEDVDRYSRKPTSMVGRAFDLLSRGEYFMASLLNSATNEESETLTQALTQAAGEFAAPTHRFTMHDVLKNVAPDFVERRPKTATALSFVGSVVLDPLTYLTFGAGGAAKMSVKGASAVAVNVGRGKRTGRFFEQVAKNIGEEGVTRRAEETAIAGLQSIVNPLKVSDEVLAKGEKVFNKLGRSRNEAEAFTKLSDPQKFAYKKYKQKVLQDTGREEAEKALTDLGYDVYDVVDKGGVKLFGKSVVNSEMLGRVFDKVGITDVYRSLADLPSVAAVRKALSEGGPAVVRDADGNILKDATARAEAAAKPLTFIRDAGRSVKNVATSGFSQEGRLRRSLRDEGWDDDMVDEYLELRGMAEARVLQADGDARKMALALGEGLSEKERKEVGEVLLQAQSESFRVLQKARDAFQNQLDNAPNVGPHPLSSMSVTPKEFGALSAKKTEGEVLQDVLNRSSLSDKQRRVAEDWARLTQEMAHLEFDAGLLKTYVSNYTAIFHKNFRSSPDDYLRHREAIASTGTDAHLAPSKQRVFSTVEQARAAGYEPLTDIAEIAALRFSMHKAAIQQDIHSKALKELFGGGKVPEVFKNDLRRAMRVHVDASDFHTQAQPILRLMGKMQGIFKGGATVLNPAFIVKQIVGSEIQRIGGGSSTPEALLRMAKNNPAYNLRDPASLFHAYFAMARRKLPDGIVTDFGRVYDQEELTQILKDLPVMKNQSVEGFTSGQGRQYKRVSEQLDADLALGRIKNGDRPEVKGMVALAKRATRYTEIPQLVEDANRLGTFLDNLTRGFTPVDAYKQMEKVHFNYSSGLTEFEQQWMTGMVPFYRFTKFAAVLTGNMLKETPGRAALIDKTQTALMSAYGKFDPLYDGDDQGLESLTPAERHALPGFLFEQPTAFAGFDPELKEAVFRMFGGVNFMDVLNIVQFDDDGSWNLEAGKRTLVSGGMSQITPFIKAPLEMIFETEFFTGFKRGEDGSGRRDIDADRFFTALTTAIGAQATGGTVAGGAAAGVLGNMITRLGVQDAAKQLVGWEVAVDPRDGVAKTYINPWLTVVTANFFPQFRTALGIAREDLNPTEHVMKNLMGWSTVKLDLQDRRERKLEDAKREVDDERRRYRRLVASGRQGRAEKAYADMQRAVALMQKESALLSGQVRGPQ